MNNDTSPQLNRCTIQRRDGRFCDNQATDPELAMPFPICSHHATALFMHMRGLVEEFNGDSMRRLMVAFDNLDTERARKAKAQRQQVVYYVLIGELLKIGVTTDLGQRMRSYPPNRKLLATEPDTGGLEARRLKQFEHLRAVGNEWFRLEGDLKDHVQSLRTQPA